MGERNSKYKLRNNFSSNEAWFSRKTRAQAFNRFPISICSKLEFWLNEFFLAFSTSFFFHVESLPFRLYHLLRNTLHMCVHMCVHIVIRRNQVSISVSSWIIWSTKVLFDHPYFSKRFVILRMDALRMKCVRDS